ncbi:endonuclease III [Singulisphaera sp. PoT]|uniref:endonuclease III n=1 Tax=Singulisphaera sp. PoT TaxID=3411797 RepID=UPI003BF507D9
MPTFDESFPSIEAALFRQYGRLVPSRTSSEGHDLFRSLAVALLGRSVEPLKAAKILDALAESGLIEPRALSESEAIEVNETLKASRVPLPGRLVGALMRLARWYVDELGTGVDAPDDITASTEQLRESLGSVNGIGLATADAILLFGLDRPAYPVDRASYRILARHGWIDGTAEYAEAQSVLESPGQGDASALQGLSLAMQRLGHDYCKAKVAKCQRCPLKPLLPPGGPIEPDGYEGDDGESDEAG